MKTLSSLLIPSVIVLLLMVIQFYEGNRQDRSAMMEEARMEFELLLENPYGASAYSSRVQEKVDKGLWTWKELGFTREDLFDRERLANITVAKINFEKMIIYPYDSMLHSQNIHRLMEREGLTWEDVGFTSEGLIERMRVARIETAKLYFGRIPYIPSRAEYYAHTVLEIIESDDVTYEDVGFTFADVVYRIAIFRDRNFSPLGIEEGSEPSPGDIVDKGRMTNVQKAIDSFESMLTYPFIVEAYADVIYEMIESGDVTWEEVGFTSGDVRERKKFIKKENVERYFNLMPILPSRAERFSERIHEIIESDDVTWEEVGFTSADVIERKRLSLSLIKDGML